MAHDTLVGACRHLCVEETWHQTSLHQYDPCFQAQQWQHRVVGMLFCDRGQETSEDRRINPYWRSFCEEVGMSDSCEGLYSTRQWPQVKHIWSGLRPASLPERLKNVCTPTPVLNPYKHEQFKVNDANLKQKSASLYDHSQEKQS